MPNRMKRCGFRRGISIISRNVSICALRPPIEENVTSSSPDGLWMTSFDPLNDIVVARDMQYTTGTVPVEEFVPGAEMRDRFSKRLIMDERSGVSEPIIPLTIKLRRTPRYAHSSRIPTERYLACCTAVRLAQNEFVHNSS